MTHHNKHILKKKVCFPVTTDSVCGAIWWHCLATDWEAPVDPANEGPDALGQGQLHLLCGEPLRTTQLYLQPWHRWWVTRICLQCYFERKKWSTDCVWPGDCVNQNIRIGKSIWWCHLLHNVGMILSCVLLTGDFQTWVSLGSIIIIQMHRSVCQHFPYSLVQ